MRFFLFIFGVFIALGVDKAVSQSGGSGVSTGILCFAMGFAFSSFATWVDTADEKDADE